MAGRAIHNADCLALLGKDFNHVHAWLDQHWELFPIGQFYDYHRSFLHNSYGLTIIRAMWGRKAYEAGRIHITRDYDDTCSTDRLLEKSWRAIVWFNKMFEMEPHTHPNIVKGWRGSSLVAIAMGEK